LRVVEKPLHEDASSRRPTHPSFGGQSTVDVPLPPQMGGFDRTLCDPLLIHESNEPEGFSCSDSKASHCGGDDVPAGQAVPASILQGGISAPLCSGNPDGNNDSILPHSPTPMAPTVGPERSGGVDFTIYLEFPQQDRPRLRYWVYSEMPVRLFHHAVASRILECADNLIRMYVNGECLMHVGTVTDRHMSGHPETPTVFLTQDCTVQVR
jgi:hypothetical protein